MKVHDNIIKLEGFGIYVTHIDKKLWSCDIDKRGYPKLDPDNCIEWEPLLGPVNDELLCIINAQFKTAFTHSDIEKDIDHAAL